MRKTVISAICLFISLVFTGNYIHAESSLPESSSSYMVDDQKTKTGDADEKAAENRLDSDSLTLLLWVILWAIPDRYVQLCSPTK